MFSFQHGELLAKRKILKHQAVMGTKGSNNDTKPQAKPVKHEVRLSQVGRLAFLLILLISKPDGVVTRDSSPFLRFLLVEAAQSAARWDPELKRAYVRLALRRSRAQAKVAIARRLATRLYWMLRNGWNYAQLRRSGAGEPESSCGAE